jgi:pimeloyl-ACP methyl ester carboxylesterase
MNAVFRLVASLALVAPLSLALPLTAQAEDLWMTLPEEPPMPEATESGTADVNGIKLYYAVYGSGEPLLMLHGGLGHSDVWGHQIPAFAEKYKVITVDSRGHGRSTRDDKPFGYDLMTDDVVALMDKLSIPKASIVGWSDGGIIGLDMAIRHPERLDKLFAFGANYNLSGLKEGIEKDPTFNAYIERAGKDYERLSPTPTEFEAFVNAIVAMWSSQPDFSKEQMGAIKSPVAISDGQYDEAIKQEHNEEMAKLIPGAKLVILPNVSHFAFWQDPELFNKAVLDFLAGS